MYDLLSGEAGGSTCCEALYNLAVCNVGSSAVHGVVLQWFSWEVLVVMRCGAVMCICCALCGGLVVQTCNDTRALAVGVAACLVFRLA